jgi:hypothetical protein
MDQEQSEQGALLRASERYPATVTLDLERAKYPEGHPRHAGPPADPIAAGSAGASHQEAAVKPPETARKPAQRMFSLVNTADPKRGPMSTQMSTLLAPYVMYERLGGTHSRRSADERLHRAAERFALDAATPAAGTPRRRARSGALTVRTRT